MKLAYVGEIGSFWLLNCRLKRSFAMASKADREKLSSSASAQILILEKQFCGLKWC